MAKILPFISRKPKVNTTVIRKFKEFSHWYYEEEMGERFTLIYKNKDSYDVEFDDKVIGHVFAANGYNARTFSGLILGYPLNGLSFDALLKTAALIYFKENVQ